jgi:hypothetical protein
MANAQVGVHEVNPQRRTVDQDLELLGAVTCPLGGVDDPLSAY